MLSKLPSLVTSDFQSRKTREKVKGKLRAKKTAITTKQKEKGNNKRSREDKVMQDIGIEAIVDYNMRSDFRKLYVQA